VDERHRRGITVTARATANHGVALWLASAALIAFITTLGIGWIAVGHRF
jgi:hypothetical protein